jgi:hypothetical protein
MSMYYNPEIVKLLVAERIKEALDAGRISRARSEERAAIQARKVPARSLGGPTRTNTNPSTCSC